MTWYIDCPRIILIMLAVKSRAPRVSGFLSNRDSEAGSVARARAAKVSIMMLIQSN
jgi:hypothetical protein